MTDRDILSEITAQYLSSGDFNGYDLRRPGHIGRDDQLASLVQQGLVSIVFGDVHPNPHIRALPDEPIEVQLAKIEQFGSGKGCAYPTRSHLVNVVDPSKFTGRPYQLALAHGEAQLGHRAFDLHVLETYRNDPRYWYESDDIVGRLSAKDGTTLRDSDEVIIRFGFAYDDELNRYVAPFLRDLSRLSPEHQQAWQLREAKTQTRLHPDYFRTQIIGDWPERWSIYAAFVEELRIINAMAVAMGRKPLFRNDYQGERPKTFASLLRPTLREFNDFTRLLDGMLSDNIDPKFFGDDVPLEIERQRADGKIEVTRKGSLALLRDWVDAEFRTSDRGPIDEMHAAFREVRKLRNKPSHSIQEDEFSAEVVDRQRRLIADAYAAIRTLRLIFANHPGARRVEVEEALFAGKIWTP